VSRLCATEILAVATLVPLLVLSAATADATESRPVRVATLLPFVADALRLAPEKATVVASVRRSLHRPLEAGVLDLGNPHSPNFERLAEAGPDLIVADRQVHAAIASRLEALGAELRLIDTAGIDATLDSLRALSERIGGSEALESRITAVRQSISAAPLDAEVKVLPLFGAPGSFYAVTDRAWLGQLVRDLGFENLAPTDGDERFPGLVVVSDEVISTLDPDMVVLVAHGDPRKIRADLASRTAAGGAWSSLARAARGIHVLDPRLFSANPGLELDRAAETLVALASGDTASTPAPLPPVGSGPHAR
jgi:iron complex transport system substrate-binding protein